MLVAEFSSNKDNPHRLQGNPVVSCNALWKTRENFNCYLTPSQAICLARNLLQKAQLIMDERLEDGVVHLWNVGKDNEKLHCGLNEARKGGRRKKAASKK